MGEEILLGVPHSGSVTWETAIAALGSPSLNGSEISAVGCEASLLAFNFNQLWCMALNERDKFRYFAMLHSDIGPESGWLDILLEEMHEHDAGIVSVAVPIKDPRGLTSCGIGHPDEWRVPQRRFTMAEIQDMPQTFCAADIGEPGKPLLLNTGCWVADLSRAEWLHETDGCLDIHFAMRDEIQFDREAGKYVPRIQPEDWFFSTKIWEAGMPAYITSRIKTTHYGKFGYSNEVAWGSVEHDDVKVPE